MKTKILIFLAIMVPISALGVCIPGVTSYAQIKVINKSRRPMDVTATRIGCLGTSLGETLTCAAEKKVQSGDTAILNIKYCFKDGYKIIVHQKNDEGQTVKFVSQKTVGDRETIIFPTNFN